MTRRSPAAPALRHTAGALTGTDLAGPPGDVAVPRHNSTPRRRSGGGPARRAVRRWAWRRLRREWRQQLLILALITVAVAATFLGAAVATNTPSPANAGFGTAQDLASYPGSDPHLAAQITALQHRFGRVEVIENQTISVPGSVQTYQLRAQDSHGPYSQPMLSLVSGHYPAGPGQVALTSGVASELRLKVGDRWRADGMTARVTGVVSNPQNLRDAFALVAPGQASHPTQVSVLFDAPGADPASLGRSVSTPQSAAAGNAINPQTISAAAVTVGMLLIALVGAGAFTVLAQRRLRSIGMLAAQGATDRHVRQVIRANGVATGVAGAVLGFVIGLAAWLAYRPRVESSGHHVIGVLQLPWLVIILAMVLAVLASYIAASRPARAISRMPIVTALSGRPAPPRRARSWAVPIGILLLVTAFVLLGIAGANDHGGGLPQVVLAFMALAAAVVLLSPACLGLLARFGGRAPVAVRLALRDLARYRSRSGAALGAISLSVLIAVVVIVVSAARFGNVLDYAGPNLTSSQLIVYTPNGPYGTNGPGAGPGSVVTAPRLRTMQQGTRSIAAALGSHEIVTLQETSATPQHAASGRSWSGPLYVATPALLRAFGIKVSQVKSNADLLTMRPGLAGMSKMQLVHGNYFSSHGAPGGPGGTAFPCPAGSCLANPVIQEVSALPSGTSAPNTVITEHAVRQLGLHPQVSGWLIQTVQPLTASQIWSARQAAAAAGMTIESKSSIPSISQITGDATVFGILLALAILAMGVGLVRSETAGDLRTLAATGASSTARRTITAATAGALALTGAVVGTACGYLAAVGYFRASQLDGLSSLSSVPVTSLLEILVGMPLAAVVAGWLLAGREPRVIGRQPLV